MLLLQCAPQGKDSSPLPELSVIESLLEQYKTLLVQAQDEAEGESAARDNKPAACTFGSQGQAWAGLVAIRSPAHCWRWGAVSPPPAGLRKLRSVADEWLEEARPVLEQDFVTGARMPGGLASTSPATSNPRCCLLCIHLAFVPPCCANMPPPPPRAVPADDQLGQLERLIASGGRVGLAMEQVEILKANVEVCGAPATAAPALDLAEHGGPAVHLPGKQTAAPRRCQQSFCSPAPAEPAPHRAGRADAPAAAPCFSLL